MLLQYKKQIGFAICALLSFGILLNCDFATDGLRNWGSRHRDKRTKQIAAADLEMWKRDLAISEDKAIRLSDDIQSLVSERKRQGQLSWKIAKAFMNEMRFEAASDHFKAAVNEEPPAETSGQLLEQSLPFFQKALKLHTVDPELLFDAGLCYANASHALGWEEDRFRTAVFLFERGMSVKPEDGRFAYQLALLFGVANTRFHDMDHAISLLDGLLKREDTNVPARFARANILTRQGKLQAAFDENIRITESIKKIYTENRVQGDYQKNQQYRSAQSNLEQLQLCIDNKPGCTLK